MAESEFAQITGLRIKVVVGRFVSYLEQILGHLSQRYVTAVTWQEDRTKREAQLERDLL
jgi:hypothetical protein